MDILINFINFLIEAVCAPIGFLVGLLPSSPFMALDMSSIEPFLGFINWVFPIGDVIKTLTAWCVAIGVYYIYSIALRWLKVIE